MCWPRGSKYITYITLFTLQHQWGSCCYCGSTKPGLLILPTGKQIFATVLWWRKIHSGYCWAKQGERAAHAQRIRHSQWLSGKIIFSNNVEGEGLSLPDPPLDILIGWKWGYWVVFWESTSLTFWSQSVWSLPGVSSRLTHLYLMVGLVSDKTQGHGSGYWCIDLEEKLMVLDFVYG